MRLVLGVALVALVATIGDYAWFELGIRHQHWVGALHGAMLLGSVGAVLGWLSGRALAGFLAGMAAGVGGALSYYALASLGPRGINYKAMVAAWVAVWLVLAIIDGRILRARAPRSWGESVGRGVLAAVASGIAFWIVLPIVWGSHEGGTRNYALQFVAWLAAFGTGVGAIGADVSGSQLPIR
jgi:hypothetical protein